MGTRGPTRGDGSRKHVQSAPDGRRKEAPGGRRGDGAGAPKRPPHAPRGPPAGGGPGARPAPVQPRPWQSSGVGRWRAPSGFGDPAGQGGGRAAGCGRPGAPRRAAASPRGQARTAPAPEATAARSRGQNLRGAPQLSRRVAPAVPGQARAAPGVSAAPPRGGARRQLPRDRPLAAERAPAASSATPLQPRPERLRPAAPDRHGRTRPDPKRGRLPRTPPPQSRRPGPGSSCCAPKAAGGAPASRQPAVGTGQEPATPAPTRDRRQLLAQWVISRGRSYKRPPMSVPAKKPRKAQEAPEGPSWGGLAEKKEHSEEEEREQRYLADQIATVLAECRQLAEKGYPSEELLALLSRIPEAERFAQFWICKAKLLVRPSTCDVVELYEAAVCAGAAPIQELRDVVVDILKHAQATPAKACLCPEDGQTELRSVQRALQHPAPKPISAVKLQVLPLLRDKKSCTGPRMKILTPVRRSLRIEHALARYPLMLQDHDPVVSSLAELMATEDEQFLFRRNDALPEEGPEAFLGL